MVTILTGNNSFLRQQALHKLISEFVGRYTDTALERLDGSEAEYDRIQEALQSLPFLAERKLVVLDEPGTNKQFAEKAAVLLTDISDITNVIIIEPKLDKRSAYYKFLKKQTGFTDFAELDANGLGRWLVEQSDKQIHPSDARYLIERVGTDQQRLSHELEKLLLTGKSINHQLIDDMTVATPQSTIFQLLEAAFAGNLKRAVALYGEQRALKVDAQQIIAMLGWQLHILALIKTAGRDYGSDAIAREAGLSPYVVKKSASIAHSLTMDQLRTLVDDLADIDERLKSQSVDGDELLMNFLVSLSI